MLAVDGFAQGGEAGEEVFVGAGAEFGDGAPVAADDGEGGLIDPQQSVEHAEALKQLARGEFEDPAGASVDVFFALEADEVAGQEVWGEQEGLDVADVFEVFGGEAQAAESVGGGANELFGAVAGGGEDDVAGFAVLSGAGSALLDDDGLAVGVLGAGFLGGEFSFGDAADEVGGRIGGEAECGC